MTVLEGLKPEKEIANFQFGELKKNGIYLLRHINC